jgi:amino acid permease
MLHLAVTGTKTYKEAVTSALGDKAGRALATATTVKTFVACLMYSIIIGDTVHALAGTAGISGVARWRLLTAVTASVLTPLCLLRSFAVLGYTSLLGIAGTLYTVIFMGIRCFDGTSVSKKCWCLEAASSNLWLYLHCVRFRHLRSWRCVPRGSGSGS